jgi:hypothetical protein
MPTLPSLRCPGCGKNIAAVTVHSIPPAVTYDDCLRRCPECKIGATNAKNPAKIKYIQADKPQDTNPPQP